MRWTQTVLNMVNDGAVRFTEFGPGPTLGNLVKRIVPETETECLGAEDTAN